MHDPFAMTSHDQGAQQTAHFPTAGTVPIDSSSAPAALTLGDLVEIVRRHRIASMVSGFGIALAVLLGAMLRTPMYQARATLALDRSQQPVEFNAHSDYELSAGQYEFNLLNTLRDIMLSRSVLDPAIKAGGLLQNPTYRDSADATTLLRQRLSVSTSRDTWVLNISLEDEDPAQATAGLRAVVQSFLAEQSRREMDHSRESVRFLEDEGEQAKEKLEHLRNDAQQFQTDQGIFTIDPDKSYPAQRLTALNGKKVALGEQLGAIDILVKQIAEAKRTTSDEAQLQALLSLEFINRHPTVTDQQKLLYAFQTKEVELRQKFLDKHPRIEEIRSQIADKKSQLAQSANFVVNGILNDRQKLVSQSPLLEERIQKEETALALYRRNVSRYLAIEEQARAQQQLYEQLLKRLAEERVSKRLEVRQLTLVDPPMSGTRPINILTSLSIAMAVVLGTLASILVPVAMEMIDRRVRGGADVRDILHAEVLAAIPFIPRLKPLGTGNPEAIPELAEAFRMLRTSIRLATRGIPGCLRIVVTSNDAGDGKSTVANRLALSFASSGAKVLIVDGDMRNPTQHIHLGQQNPRGFSNLLAGDPEMMPEPTRHQNLDFMDSGQPPQNAGDLLNSHCLPEWMEHCATIYDIVIIDTPPLQAVADALVVGNHVDCLLLVIREGITLKSSLSSLRKDLSPISEKILGAAVISRNDPHNLPASYQYRNGTPANAQPNEPFAEVSA